MRSGTSPRPVVHEFNACIPEVGCPDRLATASLLSSSETLFITITKTLKNWGNPDNGIEPDQA
jgi:hypothetical protein